ncbi:MAG: thioredoxin family protein [bacterium]
MPLLEGQVLEQVKQVFQKLTNPVTLIMFSQEIECLFCKETRELIQDISAQSDKLKVEIYDFQKDPEKVKQYHIDKIPAIAVVGDKDYGIRFYGVPAGYEFTSFIDTILMVSTRDSGLMPETRLKLRSIAHPINIQVFATLTCPYCPMAVHIAHQFAFEWDMITSSMIEAQEFPTLVQKYKVMGVPKIIINETFEFEGALPEQQFVEKVLESIKPNQEPTSVT